MTRLVFTSRYFWTTTFVTPFVSPLICRVTMPLYVLLTVVGEVVSVTTALAARLATVPAKSAKKTSNGNSRMPNAWRHRMRVFSKGAAMDNGRSLVGIRLVIQD